MSSLCSQAVVSCCAVLGARKAVNSCPGLWRSTPLTAVKLGVLGQAGAEPGARTAALPFLCVFCLINFLFPPVLPFLQYFYLQPREGSCHSETAGVWHQGEETLWLQYPACFSCGLGSSEQSCSAAWAEWLHFSWCELERSCSAGLDACSLCRGLLSCLFSCTIMLGSSPVCVSSQAVLQELCSLLQYW